MRRLVTAMTIFALLIGCLPSSAKSPLTNQFKGSMPHVEGFSLYDVENTLSGKPLTPIEGVWSFTAEDGFFAIVKNPSSGVYEIRAVDMPDRNIRPGTLIGVAALTAKSGYYDAQIMTKHSIAGMKSPKRFTLKIGDEGRLIIRPASKSLKLNLWRMVPYMFRYSVSVKDEREADLDGALRIYPAPAIPYDQIIYL